MSAFLDLAELKSVGGGCCRHNMLCDTRTKKQPRLCNGAIIKSSIVVSSFFCGGNKTGPLASLVLFRQSAYSCCGSKEIQFYCSLHISTWCKANMVFLATQWHQHYRYYLLLVSFEFLKWYNILKNGSYIASIVDPVVRWQPHGSTNCTSVQLTLGH